MHKKCVIYAKELLISDILNSCIALVYITNQALEENPPLVPDY